MTPCGLRKQQIISVSRCHKSKTSCSKHHKSQNVFSKHHKPRSCWNPAEKYRGSRISPRSNPCHNPSITTACKPLDIDLPGAAIPGPPKIDLVDCVGIFCGACMYVGGVGRSEKFGSCMEIPAKSLTISTLELYGERKFLSWAQSQDSLRRFAGRGQSSATDWDFLHRMLKST